MKPDPDCPYCDGSGTTGGIDNRTCHCMKDEPRPFQKGDRVRHSEAYIAAATNRRSAENRARLRGVVLWISKDGQPAVRWDTCVQPVIFGPACLVVDDGKADGGTGPDPSGIEAMVCRDIADRQKKGIAKYGVTVERNPLTMRQWLQHAYEECLDLAIYLRKLVETGKQ